MRRSFLVPLAFLLAASPAVASFDSRPSTPTTPSATPPTVEQKSPRQQAEAWYHDAYEDVTRAGEALAATPPETKKADKLFKRAIERAGRALELDGKYPEALNLQGYAWRKLGDLEKSIAAYVACLDLKPDYAAAREYYGQALLAKGDRKGAEAQLAWLRRLEAEDLARQLEAAITAAPAPVPAKSGTQDARPGEPATPAGGSGAGKGQPGGGR
jgi:tetratricopeptide (TPR) repeat protein